jgi:hypothetical protein
MKASAFTTAIALFGLLPTSRAAFAAEPSSLCDSPDQAVFSCKVGDKTLSVCASKPSEPASGTLAYRFGKSRSEIELQYPTTPGMARENFKFTSAGGGHWADWQLSFLVGNYTYTVLTHGDGLRSYQDFSAVAVQKERKLVSLRSCNSKHADVNKLYLFIDSTLAEGQYLTATPLKKK